MFRSLQRANFLSLLVIVLGIALTTFNIVQLRLMMKDSSSHLSSDLASSSGRLKYTVFGKNIDSGYLKHVYAVLERSGYERVSYNVSNDWTLMWAHDYPFKKIRHVMMGMKRHQRLNKLPATGFVTNKVNLATSGISPHIPKAFKIPDEVSQFKSYAEQNPSKLFVQKDKNHRGIKIETIDKLNLKSNGSFIQEFVDSPLLIDGYKFDIGIYTMITSLDPLRIYVFEGDVLIRFCPEKYEPFDASNRDKYVVHDDYRPTWKVPTLAKLYSDLGYSFKETLNSYIRTMGRDPDVEIWNPIREVIRDVYKAKEGELLKALKNFPHKRVFFEMVRFDFVLDSNLGLYLMEANMSPNLSSKHFAMNRMLYEQVIYTLLRLNGLLRGGILSSSLIPTSKEELEMQVAEKDLHVFPEECSSESCSGTDACDDPTCHLCKRCLNTEEIEYLRMAFLEHCNKHQARRIWPKTLSRKEAQGWKSWSKGTDETDSNFKMRQWFAGKCLADENWCH